MVQCVKGNESIGNMMSFNGQKFRLIYAFCQLFCKCVLKAVELLQQNGNHLRNIFMSAGTIIYMQRFRGSGENALYKLTFNIVL